MELYIIKRDGKKEIFSIQKIKNAVAKAFLSVGCFATDEVLTNILCRLNISDGTTVEDIQNQVEVALMAERYYAVSKSYMLYRFPNRICFIGSDMQKTAKYATN